MSRERIIEYHLARLKDKQAKNRKDAIKELLLLEATEALDMLKTLYETDEDEDVRKLAQSAGREIFKIKLAKDSASS